MTTQSLRPYMEVPSLTTLTHSAIRISNMTSSAFEEHIWAKDTIIHLIWLKTSCAEWQSLQSCHAIRSIERPTLPLYLFSLCVKCWVFIFQVISCSASEIVWLGPIQLEIIPNGRVQASISPTNVQKSINFDPKKHIMTLKTTSRDDISIRGLTMLLPVTHL